MPQPWELLGALPNALPPLPNGIPAGPSWRQVCARLSSVDVALANPDFHQTRSRCSLEAVLEFCVNEHSHTAP